MLVEEKTAILILNSIFKHGYIRHLDIASRNTDNVAWTIIVNIYLNKRTWADKQNN